MSEIEIEKISLFPKFMTNEEILKALEDMEIHFVTYGYSQGVTRMEAMRLIKHNEQLIRLWDIDRSCERLLHVNNIINIGKPMS